MTVLPSQVIWYDCFGYALADSHLEAWTSEHQLTLAVVLTGQL